MTAEQDLKRWSKDLDVTAFIEGEDMFEFSHSPFERGGDATARTWEASMWAADGSPRWSFYMGI